MRSRSLRRLMVAIALTATAIASVSGQGVAGPRVGMTAAPIGRAPFAPIRAHPIRVSSDSVDARGPSVFGAFIGFLAGAAVAASIQRDDKILVIGAFGALIGLFVSW